MTDTNTTDFNPLLAQSTSTSNPWDPVWNQTVTTTGTNLTWTGQSSGRLYEIPWHRVKKTKDLVRMWVLCQGVASSEIRLDGNRLESKVVKKLVKKGLLIEVIEEKKEIKTGGLWAQPTVTYTVPWSTTTAIGVTSTSGGLISSSAGQHTSSGPAAGPG